MTNEKFTTDVLAVVAQIPAGRVMTYGDVALAIGSAAPRAVGRVLALYGHAVAWWRVVPASGLPPQGHARLALPHYRAEHTPLRENAAAGGDVGNYRIALSRARLPYTHEIFGEVAL